MRLFGRKYINILCRVYGKRENNVILNINSSIIFSSTFIKVFSSRKVLPFPLHFMACHRHRPHLLYHRHWCNYNYLGEWEDCELGYKTFIAAQNFLMIQFLEITLSSSSNQRTENNRPANYAKYLLPHYSTFFATDENYYKTKRM